MLHELMNAKSKQGALLRQALGGTIPSLTQLFTPGQFVRGCILDLNDGEDSGAAAKGKGASKKRKGIDMSLQLKHVSSGLAVDAIHQGMALPACVKTVEDHGYVLTFGIKVGDNATAATAADV